MNCKRLEGERRAREAAKGVAWNVESGAEAEGVGADQLGAVRMWHRVDQERQMQAARSRRSRTLAAAEALTFIIKCIWMLLVGRVSNAIPT